MIHSKENSPEPPASSTSGWAGTTKAWIKQGTFKHGSGSVNWICFITDRNRKRSLHVLSNYCIPTSSVLWSVFLWSPLHWYTWERQYLIMKNSLHLFQSLWTRKARGHLLDYWIKLVSASKIKKKNLEGVPNFPDSSFIITTPFNDFRHRSHYP